MIYRVGSYQYSPDFLVITWDFIYYFVLHYPIDVKVDAVYTLSIIFIGYYLGKNYDLSQTALTEIRKVKKVKALNEEMQHVLQSIDEVVFHTNDKGSFNSSMLPGKTLQAIRSKRVYIRMPFILFPFTSAMSFCGW